MRKLPMHSLLWVKISAKKNQKKNSRRSSIVEMSATDFKMWFEANYDGSCHYCGVTIEKYKSSSFLKRIRPHIKNFGIDRKDTSKGYSLNNIVVCCNFCNSVKGSFFNHKEFEEIAKKYIRKLYD